MSAPGSYEDVAPHVITASLRSRVVGRGVNHAFDSATGRLRLVESIAQDDQPEGRPLEPTADLLDVLAEFRGTPGEPYEWFSLAGPAGPLDMPSFEVGTQHRLGSSFAADEGEFAKLSHGHAKSKEHLDAILLFREVSSAVDDLSESANRYGVPIRDLTGELVSSYAGRAGSLRLLRQLPSRYATYNLRATKHRNTQSRWTQHDLADIVALSVAATYCSVVVTEGQWAHVLNQANVFTYFGTTVLPRLTDLIKLL